MSRSLYYVVIVLDRHFYGQRARFDDGRILAGPYDDLAQAFAKYESIIKDRSDLDPQFSILGNDRRVELWRCKEGEPQPKPMNWTVIRETFTTDSMDHEYGHRHYPVQNGCFASLKEASARADECGNLIGRYVVHDSLSAITCVCCNAQQKRQ